MTKTVLLEESAASGALGAAALLASITALVAAFDTHPGAAAAATAPVAAMSPSLCTLRRWES